VARRTGKKYADVVLDDDIREMAEEIEHQLFSSTHRRQILKISIFMLKSTLFESIMMNR